MACAYAWIDGQHANDNQNWPKADNVVRTNKQKTISHLDVMENLEDVYFDALQKVFRAGKINFRFSRVPKLCRRLYINA